MLLSTRTTVSFALLLPQSDWLEWATLRMRNIVCFHVSRSCCCCCGRLINKLDPLHTYNLTWSCCLECDKFGLMILSLLLLATPPTHTHTQTHSPPLHAAAARQGEALPLAWRFSSHFHSHSTAQSRFHSHSHFHFHFVFGFCLPARAWNNAHTRSHTHTRVGRSVVSSSRRQCWNTKRLLKINKLYNNKQASKLNTHTVTHTQTHSYTQTVTQCAELCLCWRFSLF